MRRVVGEGRGRELGVYAGRKGRELGMYAGRKGRDEIEVRGNGMRVK